VRRTLLSSVLVLIVALIGGATALVVTCHRGDDWGIDAPDPVRASPPREPVAATVGSIEREVVPVSAVEEVADAGQEVLPARKPQPVATCSLQALVDAGIAEEIAKGMIEAVENMRPTYDSLVERDDRSANRYVQEFLFAIWPDFGGLIQRGEVAVHCVAFPPHNWPSPKVPVAVGLGVDEGELSYSVNMEKWSVQFAFTEKANPKPELFAKLLEAARARR
jgi:hypothetical protein